MTTPQPAAPRRIFLVAAWAALLLAAGAPPVLAQAGGLRVTVLEADSDRPLPGAAVRLWSETGRIAETVVATGADGVAEFPVLAAGGGYAIEIAAPGYGSRRVQELRVGSGDTRSLVVRLLPELRETARVVATSGTVDLDRTDSSVRFSDEFIQDLPVLNRFYQNVLTLAPGVKDADEDGNPNVHGARSRDFKATVGGVSNVDPLTGKWLSYVHPDSIEELEVIPAGAGAEFGRAQGGFARIVQKQGSNEFEGVAGLIVRTSLFDGGPSGGPAAPAPEFDWVQPSFQVSGPIVRDRLWYRLSHELIDREDPVDLLGGTGITTLEQGIHADQLTWQVSPRTKLAFQFQSDPVRIENADIDSRTPPSASPTIERGGESYSLTWTAPYSARLLLDTVVAYQDSGMELSPSDPAARQDCIDFVALEPLNTTRCQNLESGSISGAYPETWDDRRQRFSLQTGATWHAGRFLGASHLVKLGFGVENERYFRRLERRPTMIYEVDRPPLGEPTAFTTVRVSVPPSVDSRATGASWHLYVEDRFRPLSNLSVTLGVRYDREEIDALGYEPFDPQAEAANYLDIYDNSGLPAEFVAIYAARESFTGFNGLGDFLAATATQIGLSPDLLAPGPGGVQASFWPRTQRAQDIDLRNDYVSPRISVAWDPLGDGKTKLAATAGRYYDKIFLAVPLVELEPPFTDLSFVSVIRPNTGPAGTFPRGGIDPTVSRRLLDRDLSAPYQDEVTLAFERELWPETSLRVSWVRRRFRDQIQDVDINHAPDDLGRCRGRWPLSASTPPVYPSPGSGFQVFDFFTGELYEDTDPGPGDGRVDDCTGAIQHVGGPVFGSDYTVPDGLADLYVQNPGWGQLLVVGNSNSADYHAWVLELVRRQYRNWQLYGSYTWSEAIGDAEDFDLLLGNESSLREDERGYLGYDQRHVAQVSATTVTPWGFRLGGTVRWESGLPYSTESLQRTVFAIPPQYRTLGDRDLTPRLRYPDGQRNGERNPSYWTVDVRLVREFRPTAGSTLQASLEVFNLLDDRSLVLTDERDGIINGTRRFGRRYQAGMRYAF